jgi:predicted Zn-dependent protease
LFIGVILNKLKTIDQLKKEFKLEESNQGFQGSKIKVFKGVLAKIKKFQVQLKMHMPKLKQQGPN